MVRVCEIEITNEHNGGKQKKKDRSRINGKKATNSGREKKERRTNIQYFVKNSYYQCNKRL